MMSVPEAWQLPRRSNLGGVAQRLDQFGGKGITLGREIASVE